MDLESVTRPEMPEPPKGVIAFFSCSEKEKAYEDEDLHHGVFFHYVIEGLQGAAAPAKGEVTLLALSEYVTRQRGRPGACGLRPDAAPELMGRSSGSAVLLRLDEAALHVRRGQALLDRDQYEDALDEFGQALKGPTGCAAAYAGRAYVFALRGQWDKVLEDAHRAVEADPHCAGVQRRGRHGPGEEVGDRKGGGRVQRSRPVRSGVARGLRLPGQGPGGQGRFRRGTGRLHPGHPARPQVRNSLYGQGLCARRPRARTTRPSPITPRPSASTPSSQ